MADATKPAVYQGYPGSGTMPEGGVANLWLVFNAELVNGTGNVTSILDATNVGFRLHEFHHFGVWVNAQSASGTADVKVEIMQSFNDTAANYAVPIVGGTVVASHGETIRTYNVAPVPMPFLRFKVTGNAANPADTVVTMYLFAQT